MMSTYLGYQVYANNMTASLQQVADQPEVSREQQYYDANIGKVTSVDDFINNYQLFSYAMQATGLSDMTYAKAFMRQVLTSNLSDPDSFVNKLTDPRFKAFAQHFSFATDGSVADSATAQTSTQEARTVALYTAKAGSSSLDAVSATLYYEQNIGKVTSVAGLMNDPQLFNYVTTAYGLNSSTTSPGTLASLLESDASDPNSTAAQMASGDASTAGAPLSAQSSVSQNTTENDYTNLYGRTTDLITYQNTIGSITSVDQFLSNPTLVSVAEKAYGIDGANYSTTDLKAILTSDPSDPMSVANLLGANVQAFAKAFNFAPTSAADSPYQQIAQDFNFAANGAAASQRVAQSNTAIAATETLYADQAGTSAASVSASSAEMSYYTTAMASVTSIGDLLGNSRLVTDVEKAYGISTSTSLNTLKQVLTSDLTNAGSVADTMGASYRQLAAAFNFNTDGTIARNPPGTAESAKDALMLGDSYLEETLETNAGEQDQGVQLALYFQRKAPTITNAYTILADPALLKVVQTALNIPAASSSENIDTQATQITNRLDLASLKDPAKLRSFIAQFAALYDLDNDSSSNQNSVLTLFQSSAA